MDIGSMPLQADSRFPCVPHALSVVERIPPPAIAADGRASLGGKLTVAMGSHRHSLDREPWRRPPGAGARLGEVAEVGMRRAAPPAGPWSGARGSPRG